MTLTWMQRIDHWIGALLVALLGWITPRSKCLLGDETLQTVPERIIVTKFIGLGSVVNALPMLEAARAAGVKIAFWTFPEQAALLQLAGSVDEVWVVEKSLRRFVPSLLRALWRARRFGAQAFVDLEPTARLTAMLARLSGVKTRVGFMTGNGSREKLFTHLVALTAPAHIADRYLAMASLVGVPTRSRAALPPLPASWNRTAPPLPARTSAKRVIISGNCSDLGGETRKWPERSWVEVCDALLGDGNVELVFLGSRGERAQTDSLVRKIRPRALVRNLAGETTLAQAMRWLESADLVVCVDSGIMHLAAWLRVPIVALFGPETPLLYAPISTSARVLWAGLPCSPCCTIATEKHTRCRDNRCMSAISPRTVIAEARAFLRRPREVPRITAAPTAPPPARAELREGARPVFAARAGVVRQPPLSDGTQERT